MPFLKLFKGSPPDTFPISKIDFTEDFKDEELEGVESFVGARYTVIGMMGIKSNGSHRE